QVAQPRPVDRRQADAMAVEAEDRQALVRIVADPDQVSRERREIEPLRQPRGLGAFGHDRHVGPKRQQGGELAMQRHGAVPGDEPHPAALTSRRRPCRSTWPMTAAITTAPPASAWGDTASPKASQTQSGASGVSSALMRAVSAAGMRREPRVKNPSPRLIWTKPNKAR